MTTNPAFGAPAPTAPAFGAAPAAQQQAPAANGAAPWSTPSQIPDQTQGDQFDAKNLVGALLLITPKEHVTGVTTQFSKPGETSDLVRADIAVIGATNASGQWAACPPEQSTVLHEAGIFQGRLIAKLKGQIGSMVLGRLALGQATQGNPPYELTEPTDADKAAAMAFYQSQQQSPPF